MLVSTFELLLKPITPTTGNIPNSDRQVLQGYFLTIANPNNTSLRLRLQFTATTPNLNLADTITIRDVSGTNVFGDLTPTPDPRKFTLDVGIAAHDTGLVILQPDITTLNPQVDTVEIRGFVEIFLRFPNDKINVLLTPEHRGTFTSENIPIASDFDQLVYALPTATGSSLFELKPVAKDLKEVKPEIKETKESKEFKEFKESKEIDKLPREDIELIRSNQTDQVQQTLALMAQSIDNIGQRLATQEAFISSEERPAVGETAVNNE
ncbi:DUF4795 domain-containing protein [Okeania sp. KiyG1]|uniref:DUF4795 domain-containing protein n=1 Tax=Okeania sp. KiyG1 TaxID=2720165 RepID=UPI001920A694|nr:DUF4795 domain-containing protein [Okeania sp. KiyG1]GGA09319.1 hypothetical protein CYANOKiyG1_22220 [Okeania sp. KiyG1]